MPKPTLATFVLLGMSVLSGPAVAGSTTIGPTYIGDRSTNPEQETFGYVAATQSEHLLLGFVGPAHNVGPATGELEKETVGYRPLLGIQVNGDRSFCLEQE